MCNDNTSHNFSVHKMVLSTFGPTPTCSDMVVNHIDGNTFNNNISNLEWVTYAGNWHHAMDTIHTVTNYGDTAFQRKHEKYTVDMVIQICEKLTERPYKSNELIALLHLVEDPSDRHSDEYRTMKKFIKNIRQRRCWKSISNQYEWA